LIPFVVSLSNHERPFDKLRVSRLTFAFLNDLILAISGQR
jgi:hypothetical protein